MTSTAQKWLIGCGIGCGVMILMTALLVGGGVFAVRGLKNRFETAQNKAGELTTKFGEAEDWTPPPDGAVPAARMELFLAVRDSLAELDGRFAETFAAFAKVGDKGGRSRDLIDILHAVRGGMSIAPLIGEFLGRRNSALASLGMGMGEYSYIYSMGYYGYLGMRPEAGPKNLKYDDAERGRDIRPRLHRQLLAMLRNQLGAVERSEGARRSAWRDTLAAEVEALEGHTRRLPWENGLPPAIAASFSPYRDRLEASWNESSNVFALASSRGGHNDLHIEN